MHPLLKSPLTRGIAIGLAVTSGLILSIGAIVFFTVQTLPDTMATRLSRTDVIAFLRTDDTNLINRMREAYGRTETNLSEPLPAGTYEVAITPTDIAIFMNMQQVAGAQIQTDAADPISKTSLFSERTLLKNNPFWLWMQTAALPKGTDESELMLAALRKHPEMLAAWNGDAGTIVLARSDATAAEGSLFSDPLAARSDLPVLRLSVADPKAMLDLFTPTESRALFEGLQGITAAAISQYVPLTGSASALSLLSSPLTLDMRASSSGTSFIVMGRADATLLETFLTTLQKSVPRAEIRAIRLSDKVVRRDVIAAPRDIEVINDWNVLRLDEMRFVAVKGSDVALGNDTELLFPGSFGNLMGSERIHGSLDLGWLHTYRRSELPFVDLNALHPLLGFLSADQGRIEWSMSETSRARRIDWSKSR